MATKDKQESLSPEETVQRREVALKRMLSTPHKPHKAIGKKKASPKKPKPKVR